MRILLSMSVQRKVLVLMLVQALVQVKRKEQVPF
jgi:hypothetical protein